MGIEDTEAKWPIRKNVVACAGVCRSWREILKELVNTPEVSCKLTSPISAKQKYGKLDVIVSNAAINPSAFGMLKSKESVLDKLWDINVKASILLQDAAPYLQKGSSITGYVPQASLSMYSVTKTALLGLTKALASEMAPNTRVNCIAPSIVPTNFADYIASNADMKREIEGKTLLNRLGTTQDVAAATAYLASDAAAYVTGETLVVAGGMPSRL